MNNTKVWVVQKWVKDLEFEFYGVFSTEEKALAICKDETYCIGPVNIDFTCDDERVIWPGLYYPHLGKLTIEQVEFMLEKAGCVKMKEETVE